MGAPGDGRLDLDELGEVIDRARSLDPPEQDVLQGHDGITWGERLRSAGVTPWLQRHVRSLVVASVVIVLVGTGWVVRQRSLPPPLDPAVLASVDDATPPGPDLFQDHRVGQVVTVAVVVTPVTPGDVLSVRGLEGPGIRASSTAPAPDGSVAAGPPATDVSVVIGCEEPGSFDASPDGYLLDVRRTDGYGRVTDGVVPVPSTIAAALAQGTSITCVQQLLDESVTPTGITVHADPVRRTLRLDVGMRNGSSEDLAIYGDISEGATVATGSDRISLLAGKSAVVPVTATVLACPAHLDIFSSSDHRSLGDVPDGGLGFSAVPAESTSGMGGMVVATLTAGQRAEIQHALDRMCAASPGATATVLDAAVAPAETGSEFGFANPGEGVGLRLHVEVRTTGTHVVLSDGSQVSPDLGPAGGTPSIIGAEGDVGSGRAVLTVDWAASCNGPVPPPQVQLDVTAHGTTYPARATLDQEVLATAYRAACPALDPADLESFGWPAAT